MKVEAPAVTTTANIKTNTPKPTRRFMKISFVSSPGFPSGHLRGRETALYKGKEGATPLEELLPLFKAWQTGDLEISRFSRPGTQGQEWNRKGRVKNRAGSIIDPVIDPVIDPITDPALGVYLLTASNVLPIGRLAGTPVDMPCAAACLAPASVATVPAGCSYQPGSWS